MRPLTDTLPKALLEVGGKPLIVWHIEKLKAAGFTQVVINHAHLGAKIEAMLGDGARFGLPIVYSLEPEALETAGGIANALALLAEPAFAAINADVFSDYDYAKLAHTIRQLQPSEVLGHLVLIDNPAHHPAGDFALEGKQVVADGLRLTFSGIAVYRAELFGGIAPGTKLPLAPLLHQNIAAHRISGEYFAGRWHDIGTPERLAMLNRVLVSQVAD